MVTSWRWHEAAVVVRERDGVSWAREFRRGFASLLHLELMVEAFKQAPQHSRALVHEVRKGRGAKRCQCSQLTPKTTKRLLGFLTAKHKASSDICARESGHVTR